jgi:ADP-ribosyl-[dinitrogen reductase] hydrolase
LHEYDDPYANRNGDALTSTRRGDTLVPRTSVTHPIEVHWLDSPGPGKVGLTFAPGKWQLHAATGTWQRDLTLDIQRLAQAYGANHLVSLLEDHEFDELRIAGIARACEDAAIAFHRLPIADGGLPPDTAELEHLVHNIVQWVASGDNVVVHCKGGLGRAGTVGGCVLRASGLDAETTLEALRAARGPNCPETAAQRAFITNFTVGTPR